MQVKFIMAVGGELVHVSGMPGVPRISDRVRIITARGPVIRSVVDVVWTPTEEIKAVVYLEGYIL